MRYTAKWVDAGTSAHGMHPRRGGFVRVQRIDGARMVDGDLTSVLQRFEAAGALVGHWWGVGGPDICFFSFDRPTDGQLACISQQSGS